MSCGIKFIIALIWSVHAPNFEDIYFTTHAHKMPKFEVGQRKLTDTTFWGWSPIKVSWHMRSGWLCITFRPIFKGDVVRWLFMHINTFVFSYIVATRTPSKQENSWICLIAPHMLNFVWLRCWSPQPSKRNMKSRAYLNWFQFLRTHQPETSVNRSQPHLNFKKT